MEFIELPTFQRHRERYMDDVLSFRAFQNALIQGRLRADIIPQSGGLHKARWGRPGSGKQGGLRVIYFPLNRLPFVLMLAVYPKSRTDDLIPEELRVLRAMTERIVEALGERYGKGAI